MHIAFAGLAALAIAMGVGRFAFTPLLPMMQQDAGLSLAQGGYLASANYIGYLAGALWAMRPARSDVAIRAALLAIGVSTLAMGVTHGMAAWIVWRMVAGMASAWALVHVSAWCLEQLSASGKPGLGGVVFSGVGWGMALAGSVCLALMAAGTSSFQTWIALGAVSLAVTAALCRALPGARVLPQLLSGLRGRRMRRASCSAMPHSASATSSRRPSSRRWRAISSPIRWCSAGHGRSSVPLPRSPLFSRRAPTIAAYGRSPRSSWRWALL